MQKIADRKLCRVIDANYNRAKEGLRVCEDVCRFFYDSPKLTRKFKNIRHRLTAVLSQVKDLDIIRARDIARDVGRESTAAELRRKDFKDIFYANCQRVKESIRVLEEFAKLIDGKTAENLKRLRYEVYALEQEVFLRKAKPDFTHV